MMFVCTRQSSCPHVESLTAGIKKMEDLMAVANKTIDTLREIISALEQENERKALYKINLPEREPHKKGPPVGHKGYGRPTPTVIKRVVDIYPEKCDKCGNPNITVYENQIYSQTIRQICWRVCGYLYILE